MKLRSRSIRHGQLTAMLKSQCCGEKAEVKRTLFLPARRFHLVFGASRATRETKATSNSNHAHQPAGDKQSKVWSSCTELLPDELFFMTSYLNFRLRLKPGNIKNTYFGFSSSR